MTATRLLLPFVGFLALAAARAQEPAPQAPARPVALLGTPFATREVAENFLRNARIVRAKTLGTGVTFPLKVTLNDGVVEHHALFKSIDERKPGITQLPAGAEIDFKDSWMFEVAAYEIDKLLDLGMVPPTVDRVVDGHRGSLQFWIDNSMDEGVRLKKKLDPPNQTVWKYQMYKVRIFDNLVCNIDRNVGNLKISPDWNIHMVDHSRTFKNVAVLRAPKDMTYFSRSMMESLKRLDQPALARCCSRYLSIFEMRSLLKRRDMILQLYERQVAAYGGSVTYP